MNKIEKISVVIPMYNAKDTIVRALDSVVNQTYQGETEIIVVNDGSKDNSANLVEEYAKAHPNEQIILINQTNRGVSSARNMGMKNAKGEWLALLDSDDEWLPNKLQRQVEVLKNNPEIDFLGTNRNNEYFKSFLFFKFFHLTKISARMLLYKNFFPTPTVIMKKPIIRDIGFFSLDQDYCEDCNYWIRISNAGYNCFLLNESLVITGSNKSHFGEIGLSSNLKEMARGDLMNMKLGYKLKVVNFFEFILLYSFSLIKYLRRILIVKFRK
ncbi:glycosyltransferase family 2 protein [Soonwooa purpurea]